jgi:hypothetical protein
MEGRPHDHAPASVSAEPGEQLVRTAALHQEDLSAGFGRVWLPEAIAAHWIA